MNNSGIKHSFDNVLPLSNSELSNREVIEVIENNSSVGDLSQALKESEQKYNIAAQVTSDGIWSWDLSQDSIEYSPRWKSMLGYGEAEVSCNPREWLARVHPRDREKLKGHLANCLQGNIDSFEMIYSLLHRDRQYRSMRCKCHVVKDSAGEVSHLVCAQTDITEYQQIKTQLNRSCGQDWLTKLPNRQLFVEKLKELSQKGQHSDYNFGILCLDLDRFKCINHDFGDAIGDRLLLEIVRQLKLCLKPQDLLARLGGDQFAVLLANVGDEQRPEAIASVIQQSLSTPIEVGEHSILVSVSIGIATPEADVRANNNSYNLLESLHNAEIAMQQAKARGKACNKRFESSLYLENLEKTKSENDLRWAIEQQEFILHYQPLVQLVDRTLVGFEALIRWNHPTRGLIPPSEFIPLAESSGLITPMGWWALRSACQQMVKWQQKFNVEDVFISVNITGRQISQPYAGDIIAQTLTETGLDPRCLKLEITESEIIENIALVLPTVKKLKNLGVQLSMDDFGTGYSSLSSLHCLPVDTLKIDRSFIQGMESDRHLLELVKTIVKLAEVFELDLIAEGIETQTQCAELIELQCKYGQGFLFSKPVSSDIAETLLDR